MGYNERNGITPQQIRKDIQESALAAMRQQAFDAVKKTAPRTSELPRPYIEPSERKYILPEEKGAIVADPIMRSMTDEELRKAIRHTTTLMKEAAKNLDFIQAAQYRDELLNLQNILEEKEK